MQGIPTARGREIDLLGAEFIGLGLIDEDVDWKLFCMPVNGQSLPESLEVTDDSDHWSETTYWNASYYPGYDGLRGLFTEFGSAKETEVHAKMRPMVENPWDYHTRPKHF